MKDKIAYSSIETNCKLNDLINVQCSIIRVGYGGELKIDLGELTKDSIYRNSFNWEWRVGSRFSDWRIVSHGVLVLNNVMADEFPDKLNNVKIVEKKRIVMMETDAIGSSLIIRFESDIEIVFDTSDVDENSVKWEVFFPNGMLLSAGPGNTFYYESSNNYE